MSGTPVRKRWLRRAVVGALLTLVVLFVAAVLALDVFGVGTPVMFDPQPVSKVVSLPQNWSDGWAPGQRQWFYHATQGTTIMPYEWLISLERPELKVLRTPDLFITPDFMSRFGFLPGEADPRLNPGGKLPIGFAITPKFNDPIANLPYNDHPYNAVGLTCAACHTGRLTVAGPGARPRTSWSKGDRRRSTYVHSRLPWGGPSPTLSTSPSGSSGSRPGCSEPTTPRRTASSSRRS